MKLAESMLLLCALWLLAGLPAAAAPATAAQAEPPTVPDLVEKAFRFGDFDQLERLYAIHGKPGERSPLTGTPRIEHFWMGIGRIAASNLQVTEQYYAQMDALTQKWSQEHPQSVLAQLLYANSLMVHAWFHRGTDYANTVSPASWASFGNYLERAAEQLRRCEELAARDSAWNALMLGVGRGLGWNVQLLLSVFEKGIKKNPDHDGLYFMMLTSLEPKWGGDLAMAERFIARVTQQTKDKRGLEMYARLYAALSHDEVKQSLFTATRVVWPEMKQGFEDRLARAPKADHRNMYAYFACMAKDQKTLQQQLELIGDGFERIFWGDNPERRYDECKAMARQL